MDRLQTRSLMRRLKRMLRAGFDLFIPPRCLGCGFVGSVWCEPCDQTRIAPSGSTCPSCGVPRLFRDCPACSTGMSPVMVDAIAAYRSPLSDALVAQVSVRRCLRRYPGGLDPTIGQRAVMGTHAYRTCTTKQGTIMTESV